MMCKFGCYVLGLASVCGIVAACVGLCEVVLRLGLECIVVWMVALVVAAALLFFVHGMAQAYIRKLCRKET